MHLSPQLAARFETLQNRYPFKRSALIPMMMYAQDEHGYVSDEMIAEIAQRLELRTVQVEETLAYYSMLRRKPMGKHHVQICTNVACMLKGGTRCWTARRSGWRLGTRKRRKTAFSPSRKWNASVPARARRPCRSTMTSTKTLRCSSSIA